MDLNRNCILIKYDDNNLNNLFYLSNFLKFTGFWVYSKHKKFDDVDAKFKNVFTIDLTKNKSKIDCKSLIEGYLKDILKENLIAKEEFKNLCVINEMYFQNNIYMCEEIIKCGYYSGGYLLLTNYGETIVDSCINMHNMLSKIYADNYNNSDYCVRLCASLLNLEIDINRLKDLKILIAYRDSLLRHVQTNNVVIFPILAKINKDLDMFRYFLQSIDPNIYTFFEDDIYYFFNNKEKLKSSAGNNIKIRYSKNHIPIFTGNYISYVLKSIDFEKINTNFEDETILWLTLDIILEHYKKLYKSGKLRPEEFYIYMSLLLKLNKLYKRYRPDYAADKKSFKKDFEDLKYTFADSDNNVFKLVDEIYKSESDKIKSNIEEYSKYLYSKRDIICQKRYIMSDAGATAKLYKMEALEDAY